jgi:hypothetical protein
LLDRKSEIEQVRQLGRKIGYGNMMDIASALWAIDLEDNHGIDSGVFVPTILFMINKKDRKNYAEKLKHSKEHVRQYI